MQFELPPGNEEFVQKLEDRRSHIELMSVRRGLEENAPTIATVFVPHRAANYFLKKLTAYQDEVTKSGRPKNENLVNRIDAVSLAVIRPFFTDEEDRLPADNQPIWWEVWLRLDLRPQFQAAAAALQIPVKMDELIEFPERDVVLAYSNLTTLGTLLTRTDAIAEIRLAKDTPALFLQMHNIEQAEWVQNLLGRLVPAAADAVSVCLLDSGITHTHPLLVPEFTTTMFTPTTPPGALATAHPGTVTAPRWVASLSLATSSYRSPITPRCPFNIDWSR